MTPNAIPALAAIDIEHARLGRLLDHALKTAPHERAWLLRDLSRRTRLHFEEEEETFRALAHPALGRLRSGHRSIVLLLDQARRRITFDVPEAAARRIALIRRSLEGAMLIEAAALGGLRAPSPASGRGSKRDL